MKSVRSLFCLLLGCLLATRCALLICTLAFTGRAHATTAENAAPVPAPALPNSQADKITRLWADRPDYVAVFHAKNLKSRARILTRIPPTAPAFLTPGMKANVVVSLVIDETGKVEAARVLESSDPRFDPLAMEAALQWTFVPAQSEQGPAKSIALAPVEFAGGAVPTPIAININMGPLAYDVRQMRIGAQFEITGAGASEVRAARIVIKHAEDDTGQILTAGTQSFYRAAAGWSSRDDLSRTTIPSMGFSLGKPSPAAKTLRSVEGTFELVIPARDPAATVQFDRLVTTAGTPLESPVLRDAGITIVLYDKPTSDRFVAEPDKAGGPRDYDGGPLFGARPPGMPPQMAGRMEEMTETDVAMGIADAEERLVGVEFRAADGGPLLYVHHGWYHSSTPGKRFDIYRLKSKLTDDIKLVCWLVTPKSLVKQELKLTDFPLPPFPTR